MSALGLVRSPPPWLKKVTTPPATGSSGLLAVTVTSSGANAVLTGTL